MMRCEFSTVLPMNEDQRNMAYDALGLLRSQDADWHPCDWDGWDAVTFEDAFPRADPEDMPDASADLALALYKAVGPVERTSPDHVLFDIMTYDSNSPVHGLGIYCIDGHAFVEEVAATICCLQKNFDLTAHAFSYAQRGNLADDFGGGGVFCTQDGPEYFHVSKWVEEKQRELREETASSQASKRRPRAPRP